ncbi:hypothetical protein [Sediminibacter sp. Hel_I_10]|uniref:CBU_0592 family membrane protein n=1 Tax=Sediminibacter sp. Hel_I_10 TaxID=1392490 RepID=UPI00047EA4E8|nr:hypothetical protein [Sediminibacter sp. Hel_I_10]
MNFTDSIGSIGVFLILLAYILNVLGKIKHSALLFMLLNFVGATLACWASIRMAYVPFIILEGVWALVSLIALLKYKQRKP